MDVHRLSVLLELARHGTMGAVAELMRTSSSTVSQQIATLAEEVGATLVERDGRKVRLTPAGQRLADHAVTILAAVDAARADLDPAAEPSGVVRVGGFASAVRHSLVPVAKELARSHPEVTLSLRELEPNEAHEALLSDRLDLALVYDYNLVPLASDRALETEPLWHAPWGLAVPVKLAPRRRLSSTALFSHFASAAWIGASRTTTDETALRTIASMAGFEPHIDQFADSLELVEELILAGLGIGLLPMDRSRRRGLTILPLREPAVTMRAFVCVRRGRRAWPPLALVLRQLKAIGARREARLSRPAL